LCRVKEKDGSDYKINPSTPSISQQEVSEEDQDLKKIEEL